MNYPEKSIDPAAEFVRQGFLESTHLENRPEAYSLYKKIHASRPFNLRVGIPEGDPQAEREAPTNRRLAGAHHPNQRDGAPTQRLRYDRFHWRGDLIRSAVAHDPSGVNPFRKQLGFLLQ